VACFTVQTAVESCLAAVSVTCPVLVLACPAAHHCRARKECPAELKLHHCIAVLCCVFWDGVQANTIEMVNNRLGLLLEDDLDQVAAAAERLSQLLPGILIDKFVEAFPMVLDVEEFEMALADAKRIMPNMDVQQMLRTSPDMILSLQKGKNLIPYDQIANPWS